MDAIECPKCHCWNLKDGDNYCGYCGHLLLNIEIKPDNDIILISQIVTQKKVAFFNSGKKKAHIKIVSIGPMPDYIRFEPSVDFTVKGGGQFEVEVIANENEFPDGFQEQDTRFSCYVNNDERKKLNLSVTVKKGPEPVLISKIIDFREIKEESIGEEILEIENRGAISFKIKAIKPIGCNHLLLGKDVKFPIEVQSNQKESVPVLWDTKLYNRNTDLAKIGFRVEFEHSSVSMFAPAQAKVILVQISPDKKSIEIDPALSEQKYSESIEIFNTGNADVDIIRIETDADWISVEKNSRFTLLCKDSLERGVPTGSTVRDRFLFKVYIRPSGLNEGWSETGNIMIYTAQQDYTLEIPVRLNVHKPVESTEYIGIDFGTTCSVIAIFDRTKHKSRLVEINGTKGDKEVLIPSVLVFEGSADNYKIGNEALSEAGAYPENTVRSIKRVMGYGNEREIYGKTFTPAKLAALIIKRLIELAESEYLKMTDKYHKINHAIVTVPANFYDLQIRDILKACEDAGLDTEEEDARETARKAKEKLNQNALKGIILDEPSAAAIYCCSELSDDEAWQEKLDRKNEVTFLVYDHGGGTLDVSVVQLKKLSEDELGIQVVANKGNNMVGGDSIDLKLMKHLLTECKNQFDDFDDTIISCNFIELEKLRRDNKWSDGVRSVWRDVLGLRDDWKADAEKLKIDLSNLAKIGTDAKIEYQPGKKNRIFKIENDKVNYIGLNDAYTITLKYREFEDIILAGILAECETLVKSALELSDDMKPNEIDYIFHTGRTSLLPAVRKRVKEIFPDIQETDDILNEGHLKVCVAMGAALYGSLKRGLGGGVTIIGDRKLPHSYGISRTSGFNEIYDEIIKLGSTYPFRDEKKYSADMIRDTTLRIDFYQNSGTKKHIKNNPDIRRIGQILTSKFDENGGCKVQFIIDTNRKLEVYANSELVNIDPDHLEEEERWN